MSEKIVQLNKETESLMQAARYERSEARQGYRIGHYDRNLTTTSGDVTLHMPRLKGVSFETAIIERYRRRESSVEEALIEMYLAGIPCAGWRTSRRHCGAARSLLPPSASWTRKPTSTPKTSGTAPCKAGTIHTSTWTAYRKRV